MQERHAAAQKMFECVREKSGAEEVIDLRHYHMQ